ncbi:E3 ubiquitin/ISG15 ligase TRIM25-like [Dendropsophus ebraccatus]|uniref:E3 ubiquitin/ISG15 ligase TRIM25-like n=1 Tax=Dendropsophus ebraccatus TaxID=150705 RepID=UPI003831FC88
MGVSSGCAPSQLQYTAISSHRMASAELVNELTCSICLSLYTDPVSLRCGHVFCRSCIVQVLDTQDGSGGYSCPDCRENFPERPTLEKNRKLDNIAKLFISTHPEEEEVKICCAYCEFRVPAAKTCLECETSFCTTHLRNHNKLVDHVLIEPPTSMENVTCSIHKKTMKYFCTEHGVCVCVSCLAFGEHQGHQIEEITTAFKRKEETLRRLMDKMTSQRMETEKVASKLKEHSEQVQAQSDVLTKKVTGQFKDLKEELEMLEKQVLSEISRQADQILAKCSSVVLQRLEAEWEELTLNIYQIQDMINKEDVISILQAKESHYNNVCDKDKTSGGDEKLVNVMGDLNKGLISETLHKGMAEIVSGLKTCMYLSRVLPIIMDVNTAHNKMEISDDLKTVLDSDVHHSRPELPSRFIVYNQVLSTNSFTFGQHYWEVETSVQGIWDIGMAYPSIERDGKHSGIGDNKKSWCLRKYTTKYMSAHNSKAQSLLFEQCSQLIGIYLNYEAGLLTFYELCDRERHLFRHLCTFRADFQEALHMAFYVDDGAWIKVLP